MNTKKLNKFEMCRLLSARAGELVEGDNANVDIGDKSLLARDCDKIAQQELDQGTLELEVYKKSQ